MKQLDDTEKKREGDSEETTNHTSPASLPSLLFSFTDLLSSYHSWPSPLSLLPSLLLPLHSHLSKINRSSRITLPPSPTP